MPSLHIVVGFDAQNASANPSLVYLGRSGELARLHMEHSKAVRFEIHRNAIGIRKNNPNAARNTAAIVAEKKQRMDSATRLLNENQALRDQIDALNEKLKAARRPVPKPIVPEPLPTVVAESPVIAPTPVAPGDPAPSDPAPQA